jgi:hypothetical protein
VTDFFSAAWMAGLELGRTMGQRLEQWRGGDGERLWLSLLVAAMEEASRPEIRSKPCEAAILQACRAQLAQPVTGYGRTYSTARH